MEREERFEVAGQKSIRRLKSPTEYESEKGEQNDSDNLSKEVFLQRRKAEAAKYTQDIIKRTQDMIYERVWW